MAMSKAEAKAMADLKEELLVAKAFRFTEEVKPDIPKPSYSSPDGLTVGWSEWHHEGVRAEPSCSSSVYHAVGRTDRTTTHDGIAQYSTKLLALRAGRHHLEKKYARTLATVDKQIEYELSKGNT